MHPRSKVLIMTEGQCQQFLLHPPILTLLQQHADDWRMDYAHDFWRVHVTDALWRHLQRHLHVQKHESL